MASAVKSAMGAFAVAANETHIKRHRQNIIQWRLQKTIDIQTDEIFLFKRKVPESEYHIWIIALHPHDLIHAHDGSRLSIRVLDNVRFRQSNVKGTGK